MLPTRIRELSLMIIIIIALDMTKIDLIDVHPDPEISDQYYVEYDPNAHWYNHGASGSEFGGSEMYDDPGSVAPSHMDDWGDGEGDYGEDGEGDEDEGDEGDEGDEDGTLDQ